MAKFCKVCQEEIPTKRLEILPYTETCVNCSSAKPYKAVNVVLGEGDHTWNDIQIMSEELYQKYNRLEKMTLENIRKGVELDTWDEELEGKLNPKSVSKKTIDEKDGKENEESEDEWEDNENDWDSTLLDGLEEVEEDLDWED
jgi:hypothetical protein